VQLRYDYQKMVDGIITGAKKYLEQYPGIKSLVVGISGGVDSGLTCALSRILLSQLRDVRLIGQSLPAASNKMNENINAKMIGSAFCDTFDVVSVEDAATFVYEVLFGGNISAEDKASRIRLGNTRARMRMMYLYHIAHLNDGVVLSTDNFTELMLGFWTLHGDVGDLGFLQNTWKTEVYGMARHLVELFDREQEPRKRDALLETVKAAPTDGLGVTETDFDQLGADSYKEIDVILIDYLYNGNKKWESHPVIARHKATQFKRCNPFNLSRECICSI